MRRQVESLCLSPIKIYMHNFYKILNHEDTIYNERNNNKEAKKSEIKNTEKNFNYDVFVFHLKEHARWLVRVLGGKNNNCLDYYI